MAEGEQRAEGVDSRLSEAREGCRRLTVGSEGSGRLWRAHSRLGKAVERARDTGHGDYRH